jgi:hypothetical protein
MTKVFLKKKILINNLGCSLAILVFLIIEFWLSPHSRNLKYTQYKGDHRTLEGILHTEDPVKGHRTTVLLLISP